MSRSDFPPLHCLTAFESVARHLSVSRAAEELSLTQGAISRQVSRLEAGVSVKLFNRVRGRLTLTAAGEAYLVLVREVLDAAAKVAEFGALARSHRNVVRLAVQPAFARRVLLPRLATFYERNPSVTIDVECFLDYFRLKDSDYDAIIYFGRCDAAETRHDVLLRPVFSAVHGRGYGRRVSPDGGLSARDVTFIQSSAFPELWEEWFRLNGRPMPRPLRRIVFNDYATAEEAAVAGLGVALLPDFLTAENRRRGRLAVVPGASVRSELSYILRYPARGANKGGLAPFRTWLLEQVGAIDAEAEPRPAPSCPSPATVPAIARVGGRVGGRVSRST